MKKQTAIAALGLLILATGCDDDSGNPDGATTLDASNAMDTLPMGGNTGLDAAKVDAPGSDAAVVDAPVVDARPADAAPGDARPADAAVSEFNATHCATVADTLHIHWEAVGGGATGCTGIEMTNGNTADAVANGAVTMTGVSVTNGACIGTAAYQFTLSQDKLRLTGSDTANAVAMTLVRLPGEACFVGHWVSDGDDYLAHISASAFGVTP